MRRCGRCGRREVVEGSRVVGRGSLVRDGREEREDGRVVAGRDLTKAGGRCGLRLRIDG